MNLREYIHQERETARHLPVLGWWFTDGVLQYAEHDWDRLLEQFPTLQEPDACLGDRYNVMLTWRKDEHYLEYEIIEDHSKPVEFFYRNTNTNEVAGWDIEQCLNEQLPKDLVEKMMLFTQE